MDFLDHMLREVFRFTRNDLPWTGILSRMLREAFCWPEATRLDRGIWVSCRVRFRRPETTCLGRGIEFCVAWGFSFSRNDLFWKRCMTRMLREDFSLTRNVLLRQGFRVLYCVRYALTRNGVLAKTAVWYVAWDFCIIYCVGFSLIRNDLPWQELWIVGCVRFSLTRNHLLGSDFWVINCVRFIVDLKRPALVGIFGSCFAWGLGIRNDLPWQGFLNHKLREVFVYQSRLTMPCAKGAWRIHCKILLQSHIVVRPLRWLVWVMKTIFIAIFPLSFL